MQSSQSPGVCSPMDLQSFMHRAQSASELWSERAAHSAARVECLSTRQRQILLEVMDGFLNKQIAHHLGISEKTVKMHRALMLERLGVATTAAAVRIGTEACFAPTFPPLER